MGGVTWRRKAQRRRQRHPPSRNRFAALEAIAQGTKPLGLSEVAARIGLSRQAAFRVLNQLEENGLICRLPARDGYLVGARLVRLSMAATASAHRFGEGHLVLEGLAQRVGETCNVGVLDGREAIYVDRVECDWPLRLQLQQGSRVPSHCSAIGKLLLAHAPARLRRRVLTSAPLVRHTNRTITKPDVLESQFKRIRREGVCINDQEYTLGILGIAVPIRTADKAVVAALAIHAPEARMNEAMARGYLEEMRAAAGELGRLFDRDLVGGRSAD